MKILMVHNYYQQPGGEDESFHGEAAVLQAHGHEVVRYTRHNDELRGRSPLKTAADATWSRKTVRDLRAVVRGQGFDVAHFQNTFPMVSPAAYYAVRSEGLPVVQTLRNYRLVCLNAQLFRDGGVCESCLGRAVPWPGVARGCYRGDRRASLAVAAMLVAHRAARTWSRQVDQYIALTEFARGKLVAGGLPAAKVAVKPNFVWPDPGPGPGGGYALFVGRLSPEKGVGAMLRAWRRVGPRLPLRVVGDGPLAGAVREAAAEPGGAVRWLGRRPAAEAQALMAGAALLIFPSAWYEPFGRAIAEAFAAGTPVAAPDLAGMADMVAHGRTGLHFRPGDADDLADKVQWAVDHPAELARMRHEARAEFEAKYTAERNYRMLMGIYELAIERRSSGKPSTPRRGRLL